MAGKFQYKMKIPEEVYGPLMEALGEHPGRKRHREKYLFLVHVIARQLKRSYHDARVMGQAVPVNEWHCRLQSTLLQYVFGNDYRKMLDDLAAWGFIYRSRSYLPGDSTRRGQSKSVWFQYPYARAWHTYCSTREKSRGDFTGEMRKKGRTKTVTVKGRALIKKLELAATIVKTRQLEDPVVRGCHDKLSHFRIDYRQARAVLEGLVVEGTIKRSRMEKELEKVERFNSIGRSPTALFVKRDSYGRIHTNVTQMKKEVRSRCLYCDGKPTAEVDIKSSQGAFLGAIFRSLVNPADVFSLVQSSSMQALRRVAGDVDRARYVSECDHYCRLLTERRLYEFFADELSQDCDVNEDETRVFGRDEAKKEFLAFVFSPVFIGDNNPVRSAVRRVWEEHFPTLLSCMDRMKAFNHTALAHEMQRVESAFVFGRVIPRIDAEVGCPYCTVHDSVIVPASQVHRVKEIMDEELSTVGVPTMTAEELRMAFPTPDELMNEREVLGEMQDTATWTRDDRLAV